MNHLTRPISGMACLHSPLGIRLMLLFAFVLFGNRTNLQAQTLAKPEQRKLYEKAEYFIQMADYRDAFNAYSQLVIADSSEAKYHYGLGVSIFEGSFTKTAALKPFERAYDLGIKEDKPEIFYYLGRVYQLNQNFVAAIASYNTFLPYIQDNKAGKELQSEVLLYIDQCEKGRSQVQGEGKNAMKWVDRRLENVTKYYLDEQNYVRLTNLGPSINTKYSEYGPVLFNSNQKLVFTSRKEGTTGNELFYDGQYFEDIYLVEKDRGEWGITKNINSVDFFNKAITNSSKHDATVSVSRDENYLFIYHNNQIELVERKNGQWLSPIAFSKQFEQAGNFVTSASLSPDLNTVLIVTDGEESIGGQDIFYAEKQANGKWGPLKNLGPTINTKKNEESPFWFNDTTIYFASQGHSSIGGYDIFVSIKRNGNWTQPENLKIPINTPSDEINYFVSEDASVAYYASNRAGGYGEYDIYAITKGVDEQINTELLAELERDNLDMENSIQGAEVEFAIVEIDHQEVLVLANEYDEVKARITDDKRQILAEASKTQANDVAISQNLAKPNNTSNNDSANQEVLATVEQNSNQTAQPSTSIEEAIAQMSVSGAEEEVSSKEITSSFKEEVNQVAEQLMSNNTQPTSPTKTDVTTEGQGESLIAQSEQNIVTTPKNQGRPAQESDIRRAIQISDITFATGSSNLSESSMQKLDKIVEKLNADNLLMAEVVGHSDNQGSEQANFEASRKRALAAYNYLLKKGVEPNRLLYAYVGMSEPIADNDNEANREMNRRVEASAFKPQYQDNIPFNFDKSFVNSEARKLLDNAISVIKAQAFKEIYVVGHTDDTGPSDYNQILSEKRAEAVAAYLKTQIPDLKIRTVGFGEDKPRVQGQRYDDRVQNRRVQLIVVQ